MSNLNQTTGPALVDLIRAVRPSWDARAIRNALQQVTDRGSLARIAYIALTVADSDDAHTPAAITWDEHWSRRDPGHLPAGTLPAQPGEYRATDPATPEQAAAAIKAARAALRKDQP